MLKPFDQRDKLSYLQPESSKEKNDEENLTSESEDVNSDFENFTENAEILLEDEPIRVNLKFNPSIYIVNFSHQVPRESAEKLLMIYQLED